MNTHHYTAQDLAGTFSFLLRDKLTLHKGWEQEKESSSFNRCLNGNVGIALLSASQANLYFH